MHPTVSEGVVKRTKSTRMKLSLSLSLSSQALILAQIGVESLYNNICVCVSIINPSFHRWLGHNFTLKLFRELFQIYLVAQAERKTFFVLSTKSKRKKFINGRRGETYPHFILEGIEIIDDYATDIIPHAAPPRLRTQWYIKRCNYCKGDFHLTTISFLLSTPLFFLYFVSNCDDSARWISPADKVDGPGAAHSAAGPSPARPVLSPSTCPFVQLIDCNVWVNAWRDGQTDRR